MSGCCSFTILLFFIPFMVSGQREVEASEWVTVSAYPVARVDDASGFAIGEYLYFGCGIDDTWTLRNAWQRYDTQNDVWTAMPDLPGVPRQYSTAFSLCGKGYVCGGDLGEAQYSNECFRYDTEKERWTTLEPAPWQARCAAAYFEVGNIAYFFSGRDADSKFNDLWRFDCTSEKWYYAGVMPFEGRDEMVAFSHRHFGYVMLGRDTAGELYNDVWRFNTHTGEWKLLEPYPGEARIYASASPTALGGIVAGGEDEMQNILSESYYFDALSESWKRLGGLSEGDVRGMELLRIDEHIYALGGITHNFTRIDAVQRITLSELSTSEHGLAVVVLPNPASGHVVVVSSRNDTWISELRLVNRAGQRTKILAFPEPVSSAEMDIRNQAAGLYILEAIGEGRSERTRLVIGQP